MLHSSGWSGTAVGASARVGEEDAVIPQTEMQKQCRREQVKESYDRNRLHFSFSWTQNVKTWQGGSASWQGACAAFRFAKVTETSCCQVARVCQNSTMVVFSTHLVSPAQGAVLVALFRERLVTSDMVTAVMPPGFCFFVWDVCGALRCALSAEADSETLQDKYSSRSFARTVSQSETGGLGRDQRRAKF